MVTLGSFNLKEEGEEPSWVYDPQRLVGITVLSALRS